MKRFEALLEQESRLSSGGGVDAMDIDQQAPIMALPTTPISPSQTMRPRPPMQRSAPGASSMFIQRQPTRRPSASKPSFLRPSSTVRFGPPGSARSPGR